MLPPSRGGTVHPKCLQEDLMAKKIVSASLIALFLVVFVSAQDASKPAGPKLGFALTQLVGAETYNGFTATSKIYGDTGNADYSRTNFKLSVDFDLGSGIKLSPWLQDRFEVKVDPSVTPTASASGVNENIRNRFYAGLNTTFAFDKAFNLGINLEYRNANYLKSSTVGAVLPESRFTPYLAFTGKIEGLYYNLTTDLPIYFDLSGTNNLDDMAMELEGTYNLGYGFALDATTTLKLDLNYYFDYVNLAHTYSASNKVAIKNGFGSEFRPKIILAAGDLAPFVGFLWSNTWNENDVFTNSIMGATFGADVKLGANASFNVTADVGVDTYPTTTSPIVTAVLASIVIKG